jgi:carbamoyl-phosphate synthase small subunit
MKEIPALIALADGTVWQGVAFGKVGETTGEVVFNTSMTGYQEILTDPSYYGQIVVMSQPHIGNYGANPDDDESHRAWASGFVVRSASPTVSNYRANVSLDDYLKLREIVSISEIDTRALIRHIRTFGAQNAAISSLNTDPARLVQMARAAPDMNGLDLVKAVSCEEPYHWDEAVDANWDLQTRNRAKNAPAAAPQKHVVAYDYGIKRNILRLLASHGCKVTVVPATTPASEIMALKPDGVFLSNGPGDPAAVTYGIENVKAMLGRVPIFGICLGHQLLGLALGGSTYKLKFGHRGGNQPVKFSDTGMVEISSHNHGFAVSAESLPHGVEVTHINLNDGCVEGLRARDLRAFSVQYHPESSPGPHDSQYLFDEFLSAMSQDPSPQSVI